VEFPYKFERRYRHWYPIIPIRLGSPSGRSVETDAYVDSGAAFSVFQPFEAIALGLDLSRGRPGTVTAGDGRLLHCSLFSLVLGVGIHEFTGEIGFSPDLHIGFNVLGLSGFFDRFREVSFRHRARKLVLRP